MVDVDRAGQRDATIISPQLTPIEIGNLDYVIASSLCNAAEYAKLLLNSATRDQTPTLFGSEWNVLNMHDLDRCPLANRR